MMVLSILLVFLSIVFVSEGREVNIEVLCNKICKNGGRCVVRVDSTTGRLKRQCSCPPSYTGEYCEDYLTQVTCDKACVHGICDVTVGPETNDYIPYSLKCVCEPNYHDEFCSVFSETPVCDPPCVNGHGECIILENSRLAPHLLDHAYCNCSATPTSFYYGKACENEDMYTCNPPCLNGGICQVIDRRGKCKCWRNSTGRFYGHDCGEFSVDCNPPCFNGGTCFSGTSCRCADTFDGEYMGNRCQYFYRTCDPPCLNGGTCYSGWCGCASTDNGYYFGSQCENFTKYSDMGCNEGCVNGICQWGRCNCWSNSTVRYTGVSCEELRRESDPCPAPCQNGGVCEFGSCRCISNSSHYLNGSACEFSTECMCQNGGNCTHSGNCICPIRYNGSKCETYLDECPCQNGGTCGLDPNTCYCRGNDTHYIIGRYCETVKKSYCFPTALNGGVCISSPSDIPLHYMCPYDKFGYFYGDQCLKYKSNADCYCSSPKVCSEGGCICPYSLKERFETNGPNCEKTFYY